MIGPLRRLHRIEEQRIMTTLMINGERHDIDVDPTTPLLWVIREQAGLKSHTIDQGYSKCDTRCAARL